jgi:hypothetical protein
VLPPDLEAVERELEALDRDAAGLAEGSSEAQLTWQPQEGRAWSIAHCLDHLAVANRAYLAPMARSLAVARERGWRRRGPIGAGFFGGRFARSMEPPPRVRFRAPSSIVPRHTGSGRARLEQFRASLREARALLAEAAELDLNRARFDNPFVRFVRFRTGAGFLILAAHGRRHLWQARRVREAPGFPAA